MEVSPSFTPEMSLVLPIGWLNILKDHSRCSVGIRRWGGMWDSGSPVGRLMLLWRWAVIEACPALVGSGQMLSLFWRQRFDGRCGRRRGENGDILIFDLSPKGSCCHIYWDGVGCKEVWRGRILFNFGDFGSHYIFGSQVEILMKKWAELKGTIDFLEMNFHSLKQLGKKKIFDSYGNRLAIFKIQRCLNNLIPTIVVRSVSFMVLPFFIFGIKIYILFVWIML